MTPSLAAMFAAGLFTFGTPCVLPLVPIYLSVLLGGAIAGAERVEERAVLVVRALAFSAGFVLVFTVLGMGASLLGGVLVKHQALLQVTGGLLIFLFGLKFLGYLQVPLLDRTLKLDQDGARRRLGPLGAFGMGLVFALGWSPCVGPLLGAVLTYTASTTAEPLVGATYLASYGAGFAAPLLLVAVFAEAGVRAIRRVGRHLPLFERVTGVLLVVVSLGMIYGNVAGAGLSFDPGFPLAAPAQASELPVGQGKPVLAEFFSADCPVCKKMAPVVAALKSDCETKGVSIVQIDVSRPENRRFVAEHALRGVPTFIGWDASGTLQARLVGEQRPQVLVDTLSNLSGALCTTSLDKLPLHDGAPHEAAPHEGAPSAAGEAGACTAPMEGSTSGCAL